MKCNEMHCLRHDAYNEMALERNNRTHFMNRQLNQRLFSTSTNHSYLLHWIPNDAGSTCACGHYISPKMVAINVNKKFLSIVCVRRILRHRD